MGILRRLDDNRWFRHAHISVDYRLWLALTEVRMLFIGGVGIETLALAKQSDSQSERGSSVGGG